MRQNRFSVIDAAAVVLCVVMLVVILLPAIHVRRPPSGRMHNLTQLRGIHQSMVVYAQSNSLYFPGLNRFGEDDRVTVQERFQILFEKEYITPDYAISLLETEPFEEWEGWGQIDERRTPVTTTNYSYAMLQIPPEGDRREQWRETLSSQAIVLADRNTGTAANPSSYHVEPGEPWRGAIVWNDNHVSFEEVETLDTMYGVVPIENDRLFESAGHDDALLIHSGN